jgi:hypothetical protein
MEVRRQCQMTLTPIPLEILLLIVENFFYQEFLTVRHEEPVKLSTISVI